MSTSVPTIGRKESATPILELLRTACERLAALSRRTLWRKPARQLQLRETLSLGNRGFVAVVRFREQQFLVGGTTNSIVLLAELTEPSHPVVRTVSSERRGEEPVDVHRPNDDLFESDLRKS